jgi:hypothetical protein
MLDDILNKVSRQEIMGFGRDQDELDKLYNLLDDFIRLQPSSSQKKKQLVLKFTKGQHMVKTEAQDILLAPDRNFTIGSSD